MDDVTETWTPQVPPGETWDEQSQGAANWAIQYLPDNYVSPGYWEPGYTIGPYEWSTAEL